MKLLILVVLFVSGSVFADSSDPRGGYIRSDAQGVYYSNDGTYLQKMGDGAVLDAGRRYESAEAWAVSSPDPAPKPSSYMDDPYLSD